MRIPSPCVHKPALALIATPTADLNLFAGQRCRFGCTLVMQPMIPTPSPSHQLHLSGWTYQRDVGPWRSGTTTVSQINWARGDEPYDNRPLEGGVALERAFAGGTAQRVGWYRFYFSDERWEWSPEVEQIHGYQPGTVTPTTQLALAQAPRRLRVHCGNTGRHPPKPQTVQHPPPHHHRAGRHPRHRRHR